MTEMNQRKKTQAVTKLFLARHKPEFGEHLASQASTNVWNT